MMPIKKPNALCALRGAVHATRIRSTAAKARTVCRHVLFASYAARSNLTMSFTVMDVTRIRIVAIAFILIACKRNIARAMNGDVTNAASE